MIIVIVSVTSAVITVAKSIADNLANYVLLQFAAVVPVIAVVVATAVPMAPGMSKFVNIEVNL